MFSAIGISVILVFQERKPLYPKPQNRLVLPTQYSYAIVLLLVIIWVGDLLSNKKPVKLLYKYSDHSQLVLVLVAEGNENWAEWAVSNSGTILG